MTTQQTAGPSVPSTKVPRQGAVLAVILLDNSVIFTALPELQAELGLSAAQLAWVQNAYTLVFGGLLLLGARAGDLFGRRAVFIFGLGIFSVASLLIGLAPSGEWIIAARALQGVGAAIVAPTSLSLIAATFAAGPERNRAVALYGATAGIGASLGMVVGGAFATWISWRAGFFINVPIGAAMMILAPRLLVETPRVRGRFDLAGAAAATLGVGAIVFGILHAAEDSWSSPVTVTAVAVGVLLIGALIWIERTADQPVMPLRLFANRTRVGGYVGRLLYMGAMIGFFFFTTQFLQEVLGMDPLQAGAGFLPMTIVNFVVAMLFPRIARRIGDGIPLVIGVAASFAGMLWLAQLTPQSDYLLSVALPMLVIGFAQGLVFAPLTSAGIAGAPQQDAGAASGLVNTFHQLGMSLGLGILVAVATPAAAGGSGAAAVAAEVSTALTAGSALLALSLIVCLALILPNQHRIAATPG